MKLLLICLLAVVVPRPGSCNLRGVNTFEFGINVGRISFTATGSFDFGKHVKVVVPHCSELKYVRVDVNTSQDPPTVTFDWNTKIVTMENNNKHWKPAQYTIKAKAIPNGRCLAKSGNVSP